MDSHLCSCGGATFIARTELSPVEYWGIIIAAAAGVAAVFVGIAAIVQNRRANKDAAGRDERITFTLSEMAEDIDRLTTVTEQVALRAPDPKVHFRLKDGASDSVGFCLREPCHVEMDAILAIAKERAEATAPVVRRDGWAGVLSLYGATEADVEEYDRKVARFIERARAGLEKRQEYERDRAHLAVVKIRVANDGAVPLIRARLVLSLPDGLSARVGIAKPGELPEIPQWRSRFLALPVPGTSSLIFEPEVEAWIVSSPFKVRGHSAEWVAGDIQHGGHEDATLVLAGEEPGRYQIAWRVHANNLSRPSSGRLMVEVAPAASEPSATLRTLADVGIRDELAELAEYEDED